MKTLAQYLAEYIVSTDVERDTLIEGFGAWDVGNMRGWIKAGIEAYESTENCTITVTPKGLTDDPCESCRKCGETTCGNDTEYHRCYESNQ